MRSFFVVLVVFSSFNCLAQMGLKFGLVGGLTRAKSYKGFVEEYNTLNAADIKSPLNPVHFVYGAELELDYFYDNLYAAVGMTWLFAESEAKFMNKAKRHVDLNQNHFQGVIGYGNQYDDFEYAISGGFSLRRSFLHTYVRYPNGDVNYNSGIVNGTYTSVGIGVPLMAHVAKKITSHDWVFAKVQLQVIGVYNFSYFRGTSSSLTNSGFVYNGYSVLEDNRNMLVELGFKHDL